MNSVSMKEANWPSFIAAPFICPRAPTIFIAVSKWRWVSCSLLCSSERPTLAALVPAYLALWTPTIEPSFAERRIRPLGIFESSAIGGKGVTGAPSRLFLYPLPSDGEQTLHSQRRSPRRLRLAGVPPHAPRRHRPGRRL